MQLKQTWNDLLLWILSNGLEHIVAEQVIVIVDGEDSSCSTTLLKKAAEYNSSSKHQND